MQTLFGVNENRPLKLFKIIIPDDGQVASEFLGKAADNDTVFHIVFRTAES